MDAIRNPFAPSAGSPPPELVGRDEVIAEAEIALGRVILGRSHKSQLLLGLRGVGKTVLLNRLRKSADAAGYLSAYIEAPEDQSLAKLLFPQLRKTLIRLDAMEAARETARQGLAVLRSFASAFNVTVGDVGISVDPAPGMADTGDLENDLKDLLLAVGEAAKAGDVGVAVFIDEIQYLQQEELSALIVALHRAAQEQLPMIMFGGGLPQIAKLVGDAKSYAERMFDFPTVDALPAEEAAKAIRLPLQLEGVDIADDALSDIVEITKGYPYFLQEWGFQIWNAATSSPIGAENVPMATSTALRRLDDGFFRVRFDRLTPREKQYARAMAELGSGPHRSGDIAAVLKKNIEQVAPFRSNLIKKGMVYSRAHGDTAFTVPMFDQFMKRTMPDFAPMS